MSALVVVSPGPLSTLQDSGRWGHLRNGVTPAGAMDMIALAAANLLVGNPPGEAAIEFTLAGDTLELDAEGARVAIAGDVALTVAGVAASSWRSFALRRGERIQVGALRRGARGYLAVAGGFATPLELGSRSTHVRSGLGGGPLRAGDRLPIARDKAPAGADVAIDPAALPYLDGAIRVVLGPQDDRFTAEGIATFLSGEYALTAEADRMGYRLDGPEIEHRDGFNTISDTILTGSIQVPGTRKPIVLMADRQTTGGYPEDRDHRHGIAAEPRADEARRQAALRGGRRRGGARAAGAPGGGDARAARGAAPGAARRQHPHQRGAAGGEPDRRGGGAGRLTAPAVTGRLRRSPRSRRARRRRG